MPRGNDFSPIDPTETITGTWDFGPWLKIGVSLSAITTTSCAVISGTDAAASTRLLGAPAIASSPTTGAPNGAVQQQWGTMIPSVLYIMTATAQTSDNQVLTVYAHQLCQGPN